MEREDFIERYYYLEWKEKGGFFFPVFTPAEVKKLVDGWHSESCSRKGDVVRGPAAFFDPRYFINNPNEEIELCNECKAYRYLE